MIRDIVLWPDPVLSTPADRCGPVTDDLRTLALDMLETMYDAPGRGLAAPQVGVSRRLFVIDTQWKEAPPAPRIVIDPEILHASDEVATFGEGCLSIPGITTDITRPAHIRARWRDLDDMIHEEDLTGIDAICFQHEYDHLDGLVTLDRLTPDARATAEADYKAALP